MMNLCPRANRIQCWHYNPRPYRFCSLHHSLLSNHLFHPGTQNPEAVGSPGSHRHCHIARNNGLGNICKLNICRILFTLTCIGEWWKPGRLDNTSDKTFEDRSWIPCDTRNYQCRRNIHRRDRQSIRLDPLWQISPHLDTCHIFALRDSYPHSACWHYFNFRTFTGIWHPGVEPHHWTPNNASDKVHCSLQSWYFLRRAWSPLGHCFRQLHPELCLFGNGRRYACSPLHKSTAGRNHLLHPRCSCKSLAFSYPGNYLHHSS